MQATTDGSGSWIQDRASDRKRWVDKGSREPEGQVPFRGRCSAGQHQSGVPGPSKRSSGAEAHRNVTGMMPKANNHPRATFSLVSRWGHFCILGSQFPSRSIRSLPNLDFGKGTSGDLTGLLSLHIVAFSRLSSRFRKVACVFTCQCRLEVMLQPMETNRHDVGPHQLTFPASCCG